MPSDFLCNLVVPGAAKSGTSALHEYLNQHPEICMSSQKEPHFFCRDDLYPQGPQFHNALFPDCGGARIFGESSTGYMLWPAALEAIRRDLTDPKIIMVLRDPVARTFSHYRWRYRLGLESRSFLAAMEQDGYGYDPARPDRFGYTAYLEFSQYSKHCPMWIDTFGAANCLLISSSDLRKNRDGTLRDCYAFLGVDPSPGIVEVAANETDTLGRRPSKRASRLVARVFPDRIRRTRGFQWAKTTVLRRLAPEPPSEMTPQERQYATAALADDIAYYNSLFSAR